MAKSGFEKKIIKPGDGTTFPQKGDTCHLHYVGTLEDGTKFDSSIDRKRVFTTIIGVGSVIRGWDEAVLQMSLGEKAKVICYPDYAYGSDSPSAKIPPNSTLYFEMTLVQINGSAPPNESSCNLL